MFFFVQRRSAKSEGQKLKIRLMPTISEGESVFGFPFFIAKIYLKIFYADLRGNKSEYF